jgi:hypothetical protein
MRTFSTFGSGSGEIGAKVIYRKDSEGVFVHAVPHDIDQTIEQTGLPNRFNEVRLDIGFSWFCSAKRLPQGGQYDWSGPGNGRIHLYCTHQPETVHFGHLHIQQRQVVRFTSYCRCPQNLQGFNAASRAARHHFPPKNLLTQNFAIGSVVIDHQHSDIKKIATVFARGFCVTRLLFKLGSKPEVWTLSLFAVDTILPCIIVTNCLQIASPANTAVSPSHGTIRLAEGLKKPRLRCRRNAYTGVFNIKPHQCMCLSFALLKSSDSDLSLLCEFYRVPNEIEKELAQPSRITAQSCILGWAAGAARQSSGIKCLVWFGTGLTGGCRCSWSWSATTEFSASGRIARSANILRLELNWFELSYNLDNFDNFGYDVGRLRLAALSLDPAPFQGHRRRWLVPGVETGF